MKKKTNNILTTNEHARELLTEELIYDLGCTIRMLENLIGREALKELLSNYPQSL